MEGESVLADAVEAYRGALGDRLLAAYALGSLAHGGFSTLVSDVDLGLIVRDPLKPSDAETIESIAEAQRSRGSVLQSRLSVFWGTPATLRGERPGGRFPALDRLDLIENARLLAGSDAARAELPRPSLEELIITGAQYALDQLADAVEEIRTPEVLVREGVRRVTKLVLFPVRFLYTAVSGQVATNDAAAEHYVAVRDAPGHELISAARAWRAGAAFEEGPAAGLLRQLVPVYLCYIDDHIVRLADLGRADLARAFENWRRRLTA